jgi:NADPH:quinone reductase-like Zn-dependent oxidoreductase
MHAVYVSQASPDDPLAALEVGPRPNPQAGDGFSRVRVKAASLNHHDVWSLRGVGLPPERMPMILGTDAAGVTDDGREVVVHSVISSPEWQGDETLDPKRSLLSERHQGAMAEYVVVPERNLVAKPPELTFEEASCLPTAWLTAYSMLGKAGVEAGDTILVQGCSGGVAQAAIALGRAAGLRVWATGRTEAKRSLAIDLGADEVFEHGARLPERVDAVIESVGEATWSHSLKSLRPGGAVVVCGATSGPNPPADLSRVFFLQLRILGSTMGRRDQLYELLRVMVEGGVRPRIDRVLSLRDAREGFEAVVHGDLSGKVVLVP